MRRTISRALRATALLVTSSLVVVACSAPGSGSDLPKGEDVDIEQGRQVFQANCRACHSLSDADAAGVFGPDLDQLQPDAETVRRQIEQGGGGMPEKILEGADANLVAAYVGEVAGAGAAAEEDEGDRGKVEPG